MTKKKDEIGPRLEKLALKVMDDAETAETPADRLDGFKAVAQYYVSVTKIRAKIVDDPDEQPTGDFQSMKRRLELVSGKEKA